MASKNYRRGDGTTAYVRTATGATGGAPLDPDHNLQASVPHVGLAVANGTAALGTGGTGGGQLVPTERAAVVCTGSGDTLVVSGATGQAIGVLGYRLQAQGTAAGTITVKFHDTQPTSAPIDAAPQWDLQAREGVVCNAPPGCFEFVTSPGTAGGVQVNIGSATGGMMAHVHFVRLSG